jgi:putative ABC transport system permease protein
VAALAMGGAVLGWVLGHVGIAILSRMLAADQNLSLAPWAIDPSEVWLLLVTLAVGLL